MDVKEGGIVEEGHLVENMGPEIFKDGAIKEDVRGIFQIVIASIVICRRYDTPSEEVEIVGEPIILSQPKEVLEFWRDISLPNLAKIESLAISGGIYNVVVSALTGEEVCSRSAH